DQAQEEVRAAGEVLSSAQAEDARIREERGQVEAARRDAGAALAKATRLREAAAADLAKAEEGPARAAQLLHEAKATEAKAAATAKQVERDRAELILLNGQLDKRKKTLDANEAKVAEDVASVKVLAKKAEAAKEEAAALQMQAKAERAKAREELD